MDNVANAAEFYDEYLHSVNSKGLVTHRSTPSVEKRNGEAVPPETSDILPSPGDGLARQAAMLGKPCS